MASLEVFNSLLIIVSNYESVSNTFCKRRKFYSSDCAAINDFNELSRYTSSELINRDGLVISSKKLKKSEREDVSAFFSRGPINAYRVAKFRNSIVPELS